MIEPTHRAHAVSRYTILYFLPGFGQMGVNNQGAFPGHSRQTFKQVFTDRIDSMRSNGDLHARRSFRQIFEHAQTPFYVFCTVTFQKSNSDGSPDAHFFYGTNGVGNIEIHIAKKHRTRFDHFQNSQPGAHIVVITLQFGFQRPNLVSQPFRQGHIFGATSQQRHGSVGMRIVEGRKQGLALAFDNPISR
jgi:hypothetical protein